MDNNLNNKRSNGRVWAIVLAVVTLVLLVWFAMWLWNQSDEVANEAVDTTDNSQVIDEPESTLTQLNDDPANFIGQNVTVNGEIQDVLSDRMITISNDVIGDELTVIIPRELDNTEAQEAEEFLADNANVRVDGTVRKVTVAEVERDYALEIGGEGTEVEFANPVVLIANSITFTDRSNNQWQFDLFGDDSQ